MAEEIPVSEILKNFDNLSDHEVMILSNRFSRGDETSLGRMVLKQFLILKLSLQELQEYKTICTEADRQLVQDQMEFKSLGPAAMKDEVEKFLAEYIKGWLDPEDCYGEALVDMDVKIDKDVLIFPDGERYKVGLVKQIP